MPRYGHTLTPYHDNYLLLFGGVSEYKDKLKDRCFYADVWAYNVSKNNWKIMEFSGGMARNRKSHSACMYKTFYLIHGGIDDSEEVISDLCWVNLNGVVHEDRLTMSISNKNRWKQKKLEARYNHRMIVCQTQSR